MWETERWQKRKNLASVPAKLIDKWGNRCLALYKMTPGSYMWNSYLASFCSSTLHPPKILSVTTSWPAEPERMMMMSALIFTVLLWFIAAVSLHWQLIRNYRTVGRLSGFVSSSDLSYLRQVKSWNCSATGEELKPRLTRLLMNIWGRWNLLKNFK